MFTLVWGSGGFSSGWVAASSRILALLCRLQILCTSPSKTPGKIVAPDTSFKPNGVFLVKIVK